MKKCFFIGHRDTGDEVLPYIKEAAEKLIVQEEITQFYVGGYGSFDRLAGRAMIELKAAYPRIQLYRVIPYHPTNRKIELPQGYDGTYYPEGMEYVPPMYAISRTNQSMIDQCDFLIALCLSPGRQCQQISGICPETGKERAGPRDLPALSGCVERFFMPPYGQSMLILVRFDLEARKARLKRISKKF